MYIRYMGNKLILVINFVSRTLYFVVMALWTAKVILNNRLFSTEFESISPFGSDAKTEAMGRFGTDNVQLFPKSNALRGRV